jgi:hypothetical protein
MSASQLSGIQSDQPNLLGDGFYNSYVLDVSSLTQTLTQFNDTVFLQPGGSSANIAIMPVVADLVDRTAHITNTGLNITNIDGDLIVNNGFVQSDTINVSTLNYQTLNPPVSVGSISSIVANNTIDIKAGGYTSYINLSTGTNSGVNITNGATTTMAVNGSGVQMILSDGLYISPSGGGGGGQQIVQYPLVPLGANEYYSQGWGGIGGLGTRFTAGTKNYGSYHICSADGTTVVDGDLTVGTLNYTALNPAISVVSSFNTVSISSLNVSSITAPKYSYNAYVGSLGSDTTGNGTQLAPFSTVAKAISSFTGLADTTPIYINLSAGNYGENIKVSRHNTYIAGANTSQPSATVINGSLEFDMLPISSIASVGSVVGVQINNVIHTNTSPTNSSVVVSDCIIAPATSGINAVATTDTSAGVGNGDMTIQNSIIYMNDATAININTTRITLVNTQITNNPLLTPSLSSMITTTGAGGVNLFGCSLYQNSSASNVNPIIQYNNTANTPSPQSINNAIIQYTSGTADTGVGNKCCMKFANISSMSVVQVINSSLLAPGATTTNGSAGQILCVQRTGTGTCSMFYGNNLAFGTVNKFPNAGSGFTKTAYTVPV